jgi:hypothetical protein
MKKLFTLVAAAMFATNMFAQQGMVDIISNGDLTGDDFMSFYIKEHGINNNDPAPASDFAGFEGAKSGIVDGEGPDGGKAIKVYAPEIEDQPWDTQFWIVFDEALYSPTEVYVKFQYKADREFGMSAQAHTQSPGDYNHWDAGIGSNTFNTDWQTVEKTFTVTSDQDGKGAKGYGSIAFNLTPGSNSNGTITKDGTATFWFADFDVKAKIIRLDDPEWINILVNGNFEKDYEACVYPATVTDGELDVHSVTANGTGLSSGIEDGAFFVESKPDAAQVWDTQFFIVSPRPLEAGNRVMIAYDYRSDDDALVSTQVHRKPGDYLGGGWIPWSENQGKQQFTGEWQSYQSDMMTASDQQQAFVFNLNEDKTLQTKFYFDNVQLFFDDGGSGFTTSDDEDLAEQIEEEWATGVKSVKTQKAQKAIFNLAGQQVDKNYKGIVIENGQKRINK